MVHFLVVLGHQQPPDWSQNYINGWVQDFMLMHWSYDSPALSRRYMIYVMVLQYYCTMAMTFVCNVSFIINMINWIRTCLSTGHNSKRSTKTRYIWRHFTMMTSSNGNIFRVTGPLWGESTGHRWIPLTKANDAELWCFVWYAPEQTVEMVAIWDAITFIVTSQ